MIPPVLVTPPTLDTADPLNFGVILTHPTRPGPPPAPSSTTTPTSSSLESERDASWPPRTITRQWTGTPIRAIIPLPRRKNVQAQVHDASFALVPSRSVTQRHVSSLASHDYTPAGPGPSLYLTRVTHLWDDVDSDLEAEEDEDEKEDEDGEEEGGVVSTSTRYCSYESITAAEGLSAWSFEELRVECYAQSLVARGTKPPPVVQPALAIPPAFVARVVPRS